VCTTTVLYNTHTYTHKYINLITLSLSLRVDRFPANVCMNLNFSFGTRVLSGGVSAIV
jgi:hypothetical protein